MTQPPYTRVIPVPWEVTVLGFLPSPSFRPPSQGQEALGLLWQSSLDGWQMRSPGAGLGPCLPPPGRLPTPLACSTNRGVDISHGGIFFFTEPELDEPHGKPWKWETQATVTLAPGRWLGLSGRLPLATLRPQPSARGPATRLPPVAHGVTLEPLPPGCRPGGQWYLQGQPE